MDIETIRSQIPALTYTAYLNTGWSGPPPTRVAQAMKDRIDQELEQGPIMPEVLEAGREIQAQARAAAARLLNLPVIMVERPDPPPGEIVHNTESAIKWLLSQIDNN